MESKVMESDELEEYSAQGDLNALKMGIEKQTPEESMIFFLMNKFFQEKKNANSKESLVDHLTAYTYQGQKLGDIAYGIDRTSYKNGVILSKRERQTDIAIKDKSTLAKLIQLYLVFAENKSVQFQDYQDVPAWFDGKIQRFTSQAVDSLQTEWKTKQAGYENWLGNIRESNHRDVKNTVTSRDNDTIRNINMGPNYIQGLNLQYTPGTQRLEINTYAQNTELDMNTGKLIFTVCGKQYPYPIAFSFVRDDAYQERSDNLQEIKINDDPNSPNYKTMNQALTTANTINLIISEFVLHPEKANEKGYDRAPFVAPVVVGKREVDFAKKGIDTNIIKTGLLNELIEDFNSIAINDTHISKEEIVDFLNKMFKDVNPEGQQSFDTQKSGDIIIDVKN